MKALTKILFTLLIMFSFSAFAHEGHDHNSPLAFLVHLVWIAPAIIAVALVLRLNGFTLPTLNKRKANDDV